MKRVVRRVEASRTTPPPSSSPATAIWYGECQKNHAAGIGGYAVDGCREFMASGEDGTPSALVCAACNCHRNYHRHQVHGEPASGDSNSSTTYN